MNDFPPALDGTPATYRAFLRHVYRELQYATGMLEETLETGLAELQALDERR